MRCDVCYRQAATRNVTFYQNIGLIVMRFPSWITGNLCKSCIHQHFWKMTLISLVAGWWGMISCITNVYFILNNIVQYAPCLFMPAATTPQLQVPLLPAQSEERIARFHAEIVTAVRAGEARKTICERISDRAMVPKADVETYLRLHVPE